MLWSLQNSVFLLSAHQCIVQSYLQWLQDSDYNPNCALCNIPLIAQDTVRLICYGKLTKYPLGILMGEKCLPALFHRFLKLYNDLHCYCEYVIFIVVTWIEFPLLLYLPPSTDVFHWSCLNNLASRLPIHTAPAGYQCPTCQGPMFPPSNLASPIADMLKEQLSSVNWARAGLGLPLVKTHQC